jgi:hypothetical protein
MKAFTLPILTIALLSNLYPNIAAAYVLDFQNGGLPEANNEFEISAPGGIINEGTLGQGGTNYYVYATLALFGKSTTEGFDISSIQVSPAEFYTGFENTLRIQTTYADERPVNYQEFNIARDVGFYTFDVNEHNLTSIVFASINNTLSFDNVTVGVKDVSVPEPSSITLLGLGLAGLAITSRTRRK